MKTKLAILVAGMFLASAASVSATTRYVWQSSPSPLPPYTSWATAATNIQDAVGAAAAGDHIVVTNRVYPGGVAVTNPLALRSVNGPQLTVINGGGGIWCVYLTNGASLSGFTLTNGAGGGVWCESASAVVSNCTLTGNSSEAGGGASGGTLYNCTLTGNSAPWGGGAYACTLYNCMLTRNYSYVYFPYSTPALGGGAYECTLYNCTLTGNYATSDPPEAYDNHGGGAFGGTLNNCTLTGNSAKWGGGAAWSTLNNCIVYCNNNTAYWPANNYAVTLNYCCTPDPWDIDAGFGNITNAPLFVNYAAGDFRLRPDSPCIDAGTNLAGLLTNDILGLPRPMDGNGDGIAPFDIGAYEFNPYRFAPTLHLSASGFQFTVCGEPGRSVRIERSRDLVNWEYAGEVPIPACGQTLIDPVATSESKLFYRAIRVP
jgi:hypothetical protein